MTPSSFDSTASMIERLAVLLEGGVAPSSAWRYLAEGGSASGVAAAVASGAPLLSAVDTPAWRGLAAAWQVAMDAGAPLAPTLQRFATSLRELADIERDAQTALASPRATTRMVMVLPVVGVLFGFALGYNTLGTLFTTPLGWACLVVGVALIVAAREWTRRLLRAAQAVSAVPGLGLDLLAIAVSGGASIPRAVAAVAAAQRACGVSAEPAAVVDDILTLSARAGIPAAMLLRSAADAARREARALGQRKAAALSVTLMLPLGLCILPAFILLAVVPLMIAVVTSTLGSL